MCIAVWCVLCAKRFSRFRQERVKVGGRLCKINTTLEFLMTLFSGSTCLAYLMVVIKMHV